MPPSVGKRSPLPSIPETGKKERVRKSAERESSRTRGGRGKQKEKEPEKEGGMRDTLTTEEEKRKRG